MRHIAVEVVRRYPGSPISEKRRVFIWRKPRFQVLLRLPCGRALSTWRRP